MIRSFRAVFFDAGGTLLHPFPSVGEIYWKIASVHGCDVDAETAEKLFRQAWFKKDGLSHLASHSSEKIERAWWRELVHEVFSELGGFKDFEAFFSELYDVFARPEYWKLYPGTLEILESLKSQKKRLGIISNWDSRLFNICEGLGLEKYFDFVIASAVFGASKPSPKIFQEALKRAGVQPHGAVHIGDSFEDDIKGARSVGIHAILIERHPHHRKLENVPTIHDLKELLA